ncbi:filamentation induced by cAMP (Fic) family protein, partial [Oligella urethralis DNF00040]
MNDLRHIGKEQALFIAHKLRDELIFNMAKLEGNSLTFAETQTVIQGISVAGRPINDLNQVINIRDGWDELINQIKTDTFKVDKENFVLMNKIVG